MAHLSQESFGAHAVDVGGGAKPGVRAPCLVARVTDHRICNLDRNESRYGARA